MAASNSTVPISVLLAVAANCRFLPVRKAKILNLPCLVSYPSFRWLRPPQFPIPLVASVLTVHSSRRRVSSSPPPGSACRLCLHRWCAHADFPFAVLLASPGLCVVRGAAPLSLHSPSPAAPPLCFYSAPIRPCRHLPLFVAADFAGSLLTRHLRILFSDRRPGCYPCGVDTTLLRACRVIIEVCGLVHTVCL